MKSQPFKRLFMFIEAVKIWQSFLPGHGGSGIPPVWRESAGKGRGKRPRGTGHKHMAYVRTARKRGGK